MHYLIVEGVYYYNLILSNILIIDSSSYQCSKKKVSEL